MHAYQVLPGQKTIAELAQVQMDSQALGPMDVCVLITSSSDEGLARTCALGADESINYRGKPEWQDKVLRLAVLGAGTQARGSQRPGRRPHASPRTRQRLTIPTCSRRSIWVSRP